MLRLALSFLTSLPVRAPAAPPGSLGRAAPWFPVVGALVGALLAAAWWGLGLVFPPTLGAALVVALWAALTGGLHLDGLADCGDGMLAALPPERRLEIMHDPRLGTFGAISLFLFLLLKVFAVAALPQALPAGYLSLLLAPALARWLILLVARQPSARPGGMGAAFSQGLTPGAIGMAAAVPAILAVLGGLQGLAAIVAALLVGGVVMRAARARLGGVTGDVLGLTVELSELAVLLVFAVQL
jgi:adenosylcobinamide-GDP ribazoletransferase